MRYISTLIALLAAAAPSLANPIAITPATTFHDRTATQYDDSGTTDDGGMLFFFVRNDGATPDAIAEVRINGTEVTAHGAYSWHRIWPREMGAAAGADHSAVAIKFDGPPGAEGETVAIAVEAASGATATQTFTCATPDLRLGNVIPSKDLRAVYVYVRNDGDTPWTVDTLHWQGVDYAAGAGPELSVPGGSYTVAPGGVGILRLAFDAPQPLAQSIVGVRAAPAGGGAPRWVAAPVHLIEPHFGLGTWSSSMAREEEGMRYAKVLQLDTVMGPGSWQNIHAMYDRYSIKALKGVGGVGDFNFAEVRARVGDEALRFWYVKDEPDLHGKPTTEVLELNQNYWELDPTHPTIATYAQNEKFGRYGPIPSVTNMDHYAAFSAPNAISLTWALRKAELEEAYRYMECLKANTEPIRPYVWVQMCADGTWDTQPVPWAQNYQWWSQVMVGAKGLLWFKYGPGYEHDEDTRANVLEGVQMTRELSQVRNLCLYGEPLDVDWQSTGDVKTRQLVGPEAVVLVVVNNNYSIGGFPWNPDYAIDPTTYTVRVDLPDWIPPEEVYRVTAGGPVPAPHSISGSQVTVGALEIHEDAHVFVIGPADETPPAQPRRLAFADAALDGEYVLAWEDGWDNYGVMGYKVFRNGEEIGDTRYALFEGEGLDLGAAYTVAAYDSAGNLSEPSAPLTPPVPGQWEFNDDGDFEGWGMTNHIDNAAVAGGFLRMDIAGPDPFMHSPPVSLPAAHFRYLAVRMENRSSATLAQVFWGTDQNPGDSGARSVGFPIVANDPDGRTYVVDMAADPEGAWQDTVTSLRIDPTAGVTSGAVAIDFIRLTAIDPRLDTDSDGLPDYIEDRDQDGEWDQGVETDFESPDTDGDTYPDGEEVNELGSDPLDPDDPQPPLPAAPAGLEAAAQSHEAIVLTWTDMSDDELGFVIERSFDGAAFATLGGAGPGAMEYRDAGLAPETTYWYRAYAWNDNGASAFSNTARATTPAEPFHPADVNRDRRVDALDVQTVINAVLGLPTPHECDVNDDKAVNAIDVQAVINAVLEAG